MDWRPIETAPKSLTPFLVWRVDMTPSVAFYHRVGQELVLEINCKGHWPDRPTHWMPLPAPPADIDHQAKGE